MSDCMIEKTDSKIFAEDDKHLFNPLSANPTLKQFFYELFDYVSPFCGVCIEWICGIIYTNRVEQYE